MIIIAEKQIQQIKEALSGSDTKEQLNAVNSLKTLLCSIDISGIQNVVEKVVNEDILEQLAGLIKSNDDYILKYNAIWCFVNICCGNSEHVTQAIDSGILKIVFEVIENGVTSNPDKGFDSKQLDLICECCWLLGNIAGDSAEHRDTILERNAADTIVKLLKLDDNQKLKLDGSWTLSNLVSKKPSPFWNQISETFQWFCSVIKDKKNDSEVLMNALWGICSISSSYPLDIVNSGIIPTLVSYLNNSQNRLVLPALQALGNVLSSTKDYFTDEVLKQTDFLDFLFKLTKSNANTIQVYASWAVSNIAAGSPDQISKIIENPEYMKYLNDHLQNTNSSIKYQASCALANLVTRASIKQIETLVEKNHYLECLLEMMKQPDLITYERNFIEPINTILKHDSQHKFAPLFKQKGLIEQIQHITSELSSEMRGVANEFLHKHLLNIPSNPVPVPVSISPIPATSSAPEEKASKEKVPKAKASKKIKKATKPKQEIKKNPIRKTKTMIETLKEAKVLLKGVRGKRTSKTTRPQEINNSGKKSASRFKRTSSMKQTLQEAKKILKQIESTQRRK